ncbi:MAG: hypothetical protein QMC36_06740 [Patescibacteria group bacterium]
MQAANWWIQLLFASWLLAIALVFLAVATSATEADKNVRWGFLVPPTLALAYVVCPEIPIWHGLVAGALGISAISHVNDAKRKIRNFDTAAMTVLAVSAAMAWLPWLATVAAFVAWQFISSLLATRIESSLVRGQKDS